ncbi:unnamed protein product [Coccothraustes coccothraustes]
MFLLLVASHFPCFCCLLPVARFGFCFLWVSLSLQLSAAPKATGLARSRVCRHGPCCSLGDLGVVTARLRPSPLRGPAGAERCGTRGHSGAAPPASEPLVPGQTLAGASGACGFIHPSSAVFKEITSNCSRFSPFFHFDNRIKDDLWSMQLKMLKNEAHFTPGGS